MVLAFLLAVEFLGLWSMAINAFPSRHLYRLVDSETLSSNEAVTRFGFARDYLENFAAELRLLDLPPVERFSVEEAEAVRVALLNLGSPTKVRMKGDPQQLLAGIRANATLLCYELAQLYAYSLHALGFRVRLMHLSRSIFDAWDRHATVELWDEVRGKWIVSDPTFNVSFLSGNRYLSLTELYRAVHAPGQSPIQIKHGEETTYAYDLDSYYISYFSLLDNIFYASHHHLPDVFRYPPLRLIDTRRFISLVSPSDHPVRSGEIYIQNFFAIWLFGIGPLLIGWMGIRLLPCGLIPISRRPAAGVSDAKAS